MTEQIVWGAPGWLWPTIGLVILLAAIVVWSYRRSAASAKLRLLCIALKLTALVLLGVCLVQPMRRDTRPRPQANLLPILLDRSRSMTVASDQGGPTRYQQALEALDPDAAWQRRLAQSFDLRRYAFDGRLQQVDRFAGLAADGQVTGLVSSLETLAERLANRPVAGLVLLSDGNATDLAGSEVAWPSIGFPVYPIVPDEEAPLRDLRIVDVNVQQTDFESAPTTLTVAYEAVGIDDGPVTIRLTDEVSGKLIAERTEALTRAGERALTTFRFRPERSGVSFHRVSIRSDNGQVREATLANNQRVVAVDRDAGPYRVLYLAGRPNWEFKFLRRALEEEAEVQLVGLIRIAKQEPKFSFRDARVSDTNPLFAGLGEKQEEAAEQYDEPVIIRLGVRESEELSDGFPQSEAELFAYHGVILDDIESEFFTQDQLLMLRRFVGSRGGGLLMLGGTESFAAGFDDTPLGELSPVYPSRGDPPMSSPVRIALTREGLLQPWSRLRETESAEQQRLESMPEFRILNPVGEPKPGAVPIATAGRDADQQQPALVVQRFGKGRTAALLIGDLWRWSMQRPAPVVAGVGEGAELPEPSPLRRDDPAQAWRQLTRWLVNDVPRRTELQVQPDADGRGVSILVRARDEQYLPLDNATVILTVTPSQGEPFQLTADMDLNEPGLYRSSGWSQHPGGYLVEAQVTGPDGAAAGTDAAGWTSQPDADEMSRLGTNRELLERIAQETGGEVIVASRLEQFAADLPTRKVPVTEPWTYPLWHQPWVMITAILCLCGEWGLRRWQGLA